MTSFRHLPAGGSSLTVVTAYLGVLFAGSVTVREDGPGVISLAGLHVMPWCRERGVARDLMGHVLRLYGTREARLLADPFGTEGEPPGASAGALARFYGSLGFVPAAGQPGLMVRHAGMRGAGQGEKRP